MHLPLRLRENLKPKQQKIKIGLDYGTTCSSAVVQTCILTNFTDDTSVVPFEKNGIAGSSNNRINSEVPTIVQYDGDIIRIGFEAQKHEQNSEPFSKAKTVRNFKLGLDEQKEFQIEREGMERSLPTGKSIENVTLDFFQRLLKYWKLELPDMGFDDDILIEILCAVPAAWKTSKPLLKLQKIIFEAAKLVNLNIENILFCTEPAAATAHMIQRNSKFRQKLEIGDVFIVLDAGGGTCDAVTVKVENTSPLRLTEIAPAQGALCGSERLDDGFAYQLLKRVPPETVKSDGKEAKNREWSIRAAKKRFNTEIKQDFTGDNCFERLRFHGLLRDKDKHFEDDTLIVNNDHMKRIFDPVVDKVWALLEEQIKTAYEKGSPVQVVEKMVLLVGGFSRSQYLHKSLTKRLTRVPMPQPLGDKDLVSCKMTEYAIAAGAIYYFENRTFTIERNNRCSIGLLQEEIWNRSKPGHPSSRPQPCPLTKQILVKNCIKFIMKKGQKQTDPEPQFLHRSFDVNENIVSISVDLYSSDTFVEDSYTEDYLTKAGHLQYWDTVDFSVNVSDFKSELEEYSELNPEPSFPARYKTAARSPSEATTVEPRRNPRRNTGKAPEVVKQALGKPKPVVESNHKIDKDGTRVIQPTETHGTNGIPDSTEKEILKWHTVVFKFSMTIDGLLVRYALECVHGGKEKIEKEVSWSWAMEPNSY